MNKTIEDLKTRRSIRKFKNEQISDEDLKTILEAGTYAPTGRGLQSPKIVVVQNPETIKEFSAWNRSYFPMEMPEWNFRLAMASAISNRRPSQTMTAVLLRPWSNIFFSNPCWVCS